MHNTKCIGIYVRKYMYILHTCTCMYSSEVWVISTRRSYHKEWGAADKLFSRGGGEGNHRARGFSDLIIESSPLH